MMGWARLRIPFAHRPLPDELLSEESALGTSASAAEGAGGTAAAATHQHLQRPLVAAGWSFRACRLPLKLATAIAGVFNSFCSLRFSYKCWRFGEQVFLGEGGSSGASVSTKTQESRVCDDQTSCRPYWPPLFVARMASHAYGLSMRFSLAALGLRGKPFAR